MNRKTSVFEVCSKRVPNTVGGGVFLCSSPVRGEHTQHTSNGTAERRKCVPKRRSAPLAMNEASTGSLNSEARQLCS